MEEQPSPLEIAQRALDRLSRLQGVTAALARALTPRAVAEVVVGQGIAALDAQAGRVSLLHADEGLVEIIGYSGYTRVTSPFRTDEALPTNEVLRTGKPLFVPTQTEALARFSRDREMVEPPLEGAVASAPLIFEGRVLGAMTLSFEHDRAFEPDDQTLLIALATQCALALERARLYELSLSVQEDLRRSRDQLAGILGVIAEGVTVQDAQGNVIYANQVAARQVGYASPEAFLEHSSGMVGQYHLLDEHNRPFPADELPGRRILQGRPAREVMLQFHDLATGERRWSLVNATSVRDDQGQLQLVVNVFRDVTERKHETDATEVLAAVSSTLASTLDIESRLQEVAELVVPRMAERCSIELTGADGASRRVALAGVNGDAASASDLSPITVRLVARGEHLGSLTLFHRAGRGSSASDHALAENLAARVALAVENARLFAEAQEQAQHHAFLNVALRESVEARDRALAELQAALNSRDEFLTSASHDLKNPLSSIKATAQLLQRRVDRPGDFDLDRVREGLRRIDTIATRASGLVEELLDLARLQMGRLLDLERDPLDLVALAREVALELQQTTDRHTLEVRSEDAEVIGHWDARRLMRVFSNLLDNAIKYSPAGGPIVLVVQRDASRATVSITDRGVGIPSSEVSGVFQRFQRGSNVAQRIRGTGIGLASAKHIVESHGGTILVESEEGEGTTFVIRLPLEPETTQPVTAEADA